MLKNLSLMMCVVVLFVLLGSALRRSQIAEEPFVFPFAALPE
jgi:hypothetical protein